MRRIRQINSFPESHDELYISLSFETENDPDKRFQRDALEHIEADEYKQIKTTKEEIERRVQEHNRKVAEFAHWENLLPKEIIDSTGLKEDRQSLNAIPLDETFNTQNLLEYFREVYNYLNGVRLVVQKREKDGKIKLESATVFVHRTIAVSEDHVKIEKLQDLLKQWANEYINKVRSFISEIGSIEEQLKKTKEGFQSIIYDIDEDNFKGTCDYERSLEK